MSTAELQQPIPHPQHEEGLEFEQTPETLSELVAKFAVSQADIEIETPRAITPAYLPHALAVKDELYERYTKLLQAGEVDTSTDIELFNQVVRVAEYHTALAYLRADMPLEVRGMLGLVTDRLQKMALFGAATALDNQAALEVTKYYTTDDNLEAELKAAKDFKQLGSYNLFLMGAGLGIHKAFDNLKLLHSTRGVDFSRWIDTETVKWTLSSLIQQHEFGTAFELAQLHGSRGYLRAVALAELVADGATLSQRSRDVIAATSGVDKRDLKKLLQIKDTTQIAAIFKWSTVPEELKDALEILEVVQSYTHPSRLHLNTAHAVNMAYEGRRNIKVVHMDQPGLTFATDEQLATAFELRLEELAAGSITEGLPDAYHGLIAAGMELVARGTGLDESSVEDMAKVHAGIELLLADQPSKAHVMVEDFYSVHANSQKHVAELSTLIQHARGIRNPLLRAQATLELQRFFETSSYDVSEVTNYLEDLKSLASKSLQSSVFQRILGVAPTHNSHS